MVGRRDIASMASTPMIPPWLKSGRRRLRVMPSPVSTDGAYLQTQAKASDIAVAIHGRGD